MSGTNFHRQRTSESSRKNQGDMRDRIQTGMILSRLHGLINGDHDMPPHAVTAAGILLRKTLPDLTTNTLTGESGGPLQVIFRAVNDGTTDST